MTERVRHSRDWRALMRKHSLKMFNNTHSNIVSSPPTNTLSPVTVTMTKLFSIFNTTLLLWIHFVSRLPSRNASPVESIGA